MAGFIEEEIIILLINSFEALLDTTEELLQDHVDEPDQLGKVGDMGVITELDKEGH